MLKSRPKIGITIGDPCGIGPEVVAKALMNLSDQDLGANFCVIGDYHVFSDYYPHFKRNHFIDLKNIDLQHFIPGKGGRVSGQASFDFLTHAVQLLKEKKIQGLVTAPVSKEAISSIGVKFHGHTEFLADSFDVKKFAMMFITESLKTVVVTRHVPLRKVSQILTKQNIYETILLTSQVLRQFFKKPNARIAVCGLNPHAGEGGKIGKEEILKIIPAIKKASHRGINLSGPLAADTLFSPVIAQHFDAVIAMYHDQGLIPVKTLYFSQLVNLTAGLPFIRTSPAHGTAFDIAGKNKADPQSMIAAIKLAATLST